MAIAQAPVIPDASSLPTDPVVAVAFLAVVALGMILFYFGKPLQDRVRGGAKDKPADIAPPTPVLPSPVQVLDRTTEMTNALIQVLKDQIADQDVENDRLRREIERLREDLEHCRDQWRRP